MGWNAWTKVHIRIEITCIINQKLVFIPRIPHQSMLILDTNYCKLFLHGRSIHKHCWKSQQLLSHWDAIAKPMNVLYSPLPIATNSSQNSPSHSSPRKPRLSYLHGTGPVWQRANLSSTPVFFAKKSEWRQSKERESEIAVIILGWQSSELLSGISLQEESPRHCCMNIHHAPIPHEVEKVATWVMIQNSFLNNRWSHGWFRKPHQIRQEACWSIGTRNSLLPAWAVAVPIDLAIGFPISSHHFFQPKRLNEIAGQEKKLYIRESPICEDLKTSHLDLYCSHFRVIIFHLSLCDVPNSTFRFLDHGIEQKTLASGLESPDIVDQCSLESHRLPAPRSRSYLQK